MRYCSTYIRWLNSLNLQQNLWEHDYNKCVCFMGEVSGEHPIGTGTRKVKDLNLKTLTSQWDFFSLVNNGFNI